MAKPRTPLVPNEMYHLWTHANGTENLFRTEENYFFFLGKYQYYLAPFVDTFAYCLMPNHLHLMIRVRDEAELLALPGWGTLEEPELSKAISRQVSHLFNSYTQAFNNKYNRKGSLFIDSFHRKHINTDEYFTALIAYIHNNPVHHGFVEDPEDWPFSSLHTYMINKTTLLDKVGSVNKKEGLDLFGGLEAFKTAHKGFKVEWMAEVLEREG